MAWISHFHHIRLLYSYPPQGKFFWLLQSHNSPVKIAWSTRSVVEVICRIRISAGTLSPTRRQKQTNKCIHNRRTDKQLSARPRAYAAENQRVGKTRRRSIYSADRHATRDASQPKWQYPAESWVFRDITEVPVSRDLWPWPWAHPGCRPVRGPWCASLVAIQPFVW